MIWFNLQLWDFRVKAVTTETLHLALLDVFSLGQPVSPAGQAFLWGQLKPSSKNFPCLHLQVDQRWHDGVSIQCLVFNGQSLSILWHIAGPPPRVKPPTNSCVCLFVLFSSMWHTDRRTDGQPCISLIGLTCSWDLVNSVMDSPGVHGDILSILVPLRAGREDKHFLYHSDTHLLSDSVRPALCALEVVNGFSLAFPMKQQIKEIFCFMWGVCDVTDKQDSTVNLYNIRCAVYVPSVKQHVYMMC